MNEQNLYNSQVPPQMPMMPPPPVPMTRRARLGKQLMSGKAFGFTTLPDWFASYAVGTYAVALLGVNMVYTANATEWYFWVFGIAWVAGFFFLSVKFSREWSVKHVRHHKAFEKKVFGIGLLLRMFYAVFIYFFYIQMTGKPYEFASADSLGYIETAEWLVQEWEVGRLGTSVSNLAATSFSDMGYPLFLLLPVRIFGVDGALLIVRLIHAIFGAYTAVIVYRLASRTMGETVGRMAAIFCMLHPVLICYVGLTLKEVFMTWLFVLFVDLADRMLVGKNYSFTTIAPVVLIGVVIFMFRTVLGMVAFMSIFFALTVMDTRLVGWGKKVVLGILMAGAVLFVASDNIMKEVNKIRSTDVRSEQASTMKNRYGSEKGGKLSGNSFANYAGAAVFAPLIFTIPFPTMVDIGFQEDMRLIHGGNWMRNVMSGFVILAMFMLLLSGDWRKYTLPLAVLLGYLVVLVFSSFAHSLRFHIPVMPFEMMFAAYAITNMRKKHRNWYLIWCILCIVMCFGWNWMKLKGRGM